MQADPRLHFDHAGGDIDEAHTQGVELCQTQGRTFRHDRSKAPHEPIGPRMQEQAKLVCRRLAARGPVGGEMGLPGFDMVLGHAPAAINAFVQSPGAPTWEIGHDEARVATLRPNLDTGDDPLGPAPARRPVIEFLEASDLGLGLRLLEAQGRAGLDGCHAFVQRAGRRHAEDEGDAVRPAPVEHLGGTIVAIAPDQDPGMGPVSADRPDETAHMRTDLAATRAFGRAQNSGHETTLAIEHHDWLEAVFIVMRVEQPQLLLPVNGIEGIVDVELDLRGHCPERAAIQAGHGMTHGLKHAPVGQVLQASDRRLGSQILIAGESAPCHLEDGIGPQARGVIGIFITGGDHAHPEADHLVEPVGDHLGTPRIIDACSQRRGNTQALFHLRQSDQAAI